MFRKRRKARVPSETAPAVDSAVDQRGQQTEAVESADQQATDAQPPAPQPATPAADAVPKPGQFTMPWYRRPK